MRIKTISRTEEDFCRSTTLDVMKVHRNRDPALHPFQRAREYTKALVSTKLDKIFAKPFVGALDGHNDGIHCMSTVRTKNVPFISGACDGEIRIWDLSFERVVWSAIAHTGFVRGIAPDVKGEKFYTCGDDKLIKRWDLQPDGNSPDTVLPLSTFISPHTLHTIDHHWVDEQFASGGEVVSIWDPNRVDPVHSYQWGNDSILSLKFNPAEAALLASTCGDRSICLYDLRAAVPMRKFVLPMRSNKVVWNPREPFNFVLANEDHNLYSFDMRYLDKAVMIHKDHVSAVMDVAFSPTGREFVSGSYDRTVRIFRADSGRSREVYHTKRMQRVFSVQVSSDAKFLLSGSEDTNVRLWKMEASKTLAINPGRKERKEKLQDSLKRRFANMPEIRRISRDKKIPKAIKKAGALNHEQTVSRKRKEDNRARHSAGDETVLPQRKKVVIKEIL